MKIRAVGRLALKSENKRNILASSICKSDVMAIALVHSSCEYWISFFQLREIAFLLVEATVCCWFYDQQK